MLRNLLYFLAAKSPERSLRLLFFTAFWSAKAAQKPPRRQKRLKDTFFDKRESFAAIGGVRRGATTGSETQKPSIAPGSGFKPPHYRLQRKKTARRRSVKNRVGLLATTSSRREQSLLCRAATVEAAHSFAPQTREGARFSVAELRSRESDMRMVLGTFCHQKVQNPLR